MTVPAIRERMVASLLNVSPQLAGAVADGLGMALPDPLPRALKNPAKPEVTVSPPLSLLALPGERGVRTRKVAILVANGVEGKSVAAIRSALLDAGAVPRLLAPRLGTVIAARDEKIPVDASLENSPSVLFDAVVLPDGEEAVRALLRDGHTLEFVKDQYRHCKTILAMGASQAILAAAGIKRTLHSGEADPGLLLVDAAGVPPPRPASSKR